MLNDRYVLSQLMDFLPEHDFDHGVARHRGNCTRRQAVSLASLSGSRAWIRENRLCRDRRTVREDIPSPSIGRKTHFGRVVRVRRCPGRRRFSWWIPGVPGGDRRGRDARRRGLRSRPLRSEAGKQVRSRFRPAAPGPFLCAMTRFCTNPRPWAKQKKPMWPNTRRMFGHIGLLLDEPPGPAELPLIKSSDES